MKLMTKLAERAALLGTLLLPVFAVACLNPKAYEIPAGPESAFFRTVSRVVERHDAYVAVDPDADPGALPQSAEALALSESIFLLPVQVISPSLEPVLSRHDGYVIADEDVDELELLFYLEDSERLRDLMSQAQKGVR